MYGYLFSFPTEERLTNFPYLAKVTFYIGGCMLLLVLLLLLVAAWAFYASFRPVKHGLYQGVNPAIVKFLTTELNRFPLHKAVFQNDFHTVDRLLALSYTLDMETDDGQTPLHIAAQCGLDGMCRHLIKRGARLDKLDNFGGTPLHAAAACQSGLTVIQTLEKHGADLHLKDAAGLTPRAVARNYKHYKIAAYLKLRGA